MWTKIAIAGWYGLFAFISLIPFYYLPPFELVGLELPLLKVLPSGLLFIILGAWFFATIKGSLSFRRPPAHAWVILWLVINVLGLFNAPYPRIGAAKWSYFAFTGPALYYLAYNIFTTNRQVCHFCLYAGFIGAIVAIYGIIEFLLSVNPLYDGYYALYNPYYSIGRVSSSIGNPIALGSYLLFLVPLIFFTLVEGGSQSRILWWLFAFAAIVVCIVLTFARGVWVPAFFVVVILWWLTRDRCQFDYLAKHLLTGLIIFLLAWPGIETLLVSHGGKVDFDALGVLLTAKERLNIAAIIDSEPFRFRVGQFAAVSRVIADYPLLGVGIGNYTSVFGHYNPELTDSLVQTTDNMYLMVLAETGVLGATAFFVLNISLIKPLVQSLRNRQTESWLLPLTLSLSSFYLVLLGWDALNHPVLRMVFWMICGLAAALTSNRFVVGAREAERTNS